MNIVIILIPLALIIVVIFLAAFFWASKQGQFDDLISPAHRILTEENDFDQDSLKKFDTKKQSPTLSKNNRQTKS